MGLFIGFRKKKESAAEESKKVEVKAEELQKDASEKQEKEFEAPGWDAITAEFERVYPGQTTGIDAHQKSNLTTNPDISVMISLALQCFSVI